MQIADGPMEDFIGIHIFNVPNVGVLSTERKSIMKRQELIDILCFAGFVLIVLGYMISNSEGAKFILFAISLMYAIEYFKNWLRKYLLRKEVERWMKEVS